MVNPQEKDSNEKVFHNSAPVLTPDQQRLVNSKFQKVLQSVYAEIDKDTGLRWSARDISEVGGARKILRSEVKTEDKEHNAKWQSETNATFGYGEITRVSIF